MNALHVQNRRINASNIPAQNETDMPRRTRMGYKTRRVGEGQEICQLDLAYKERTEPNKRLTDATRSPGARRDASSYIKYSRRGAKQRNTPRTMRARSNMPDAPLLPWPSGLTCMKEQSRGGDNPGEKIL